MNLESLFRASSGAAPVMTAFGFYLLISPLPSCSETQVIHEREGVTMQTTVQNVAVKSFLALERGQQWATSGELTHRKAFLLGAALAAVMMAGGALAAAPVGAETVDTNGSKNPIDQIRATICSVAGVLQGPIGVGVIIACVVIAGLSMAFGGRNSTSLLISALVGAAVIFGARTLVGFVAGGTSGATTCTTTA